MRRNAIWPGASENFQVSRRDVSRLRGTRRAAGRLSIRARHQGAVLIIALGVLTIMAILGTAFAQLMRLERRATENYLEARRMDFLVDSALNRVIAGLQGAKNWRSYTFYRDTPWLFQLRNEDTLGHGRADIRDRRVSQWEMFARRGGSEQWYTTKVLDCASQINLNSRQDTLARMLDNLGDAIERSERLQRDGKKVYNPFFTRPNHGGRRVRGADIIRLRRRLPNGRFTSKTQLKQLIGNENYEVVKDFVACYGWEDPYTMVADDGLNEVPELLGGAGLGGNTASVERQPAASDNPRYSSEPRYPVNVNTAPEEVLIACIQGLAGRRFFPFARLGAAGATMRTIDANAQLFGMGRKVVGDEEIGNVIPRGIFVYSPRIEYPGAKRIAEQIMVQRKVRPFLAWRTNDPGRQGFEDFIDRLEASYFPSQGNVIVIDPDQPQNQQIRTLLMAGGAENPVARRWIRGTARPGARSIYRSVARAFDDSFAWYFQLARGVLKANFNPNSRINRYNPNQPAYVEVDKSDLVWARDRFTLFKGHTTEFCFDTMGYYEITALGQIGPIENRLSGRGVTMVAGGRGRRGRGRTGLDMPPPFERPFERQVRTVVQIFDVLRHTNQYHFEKTFQSGSSSSANNRKFVQTWPEPMEALTELVSGGSLRDGRVELAGLLDGRRELTPYQNRVQTYRQNPLLTMAIGFDARDSQSIATLRRIKSSSSGALFGNELNEALNDVLNAPYSRFGGRYREYYRRSHLLEMGNVFTNQSTVYQDPRVGKEVLGTDIMPDGFHSSLLTTPHIGARVLALPARQRIDLGREESAIVRVGASGVGSRGQNSLGNVPYYRGGIAFWVKFDFDADDPVFSGLIGCTEVIKEVSTNAADFTGSEGTQFFIFKNSQGLLRVTRMYYHQAFLHTLSGGSGTGGGGDAGAGGLIQLYPQSTSLAGGASGGANERDPILENLDPQKPMSRIDLIADIRHIKAHEWHHIAVDWQDEGSPSNALRLYLDFQEVRQGGGPILAQAEFDGTPNSWVRLNERQPRDGLLIGGIIREQGDRDNGLFKWYTNSSTLGGGRSGVTPVATDVKRIMANATIDELVVYEGTFPGVKPYYGSTGAPGYFTNQQGEYANVFEIPLPPHVNFAVLRALDWTSYYPTTYTDSLPNSIPQRVNVDRITCQVTYLPAGTGALPGSFQDPWITQEPVNRLGGRRIARRQTGLKGNNAELVYTFRMRAANAIGGNTSGGFVASPVIDDVTLSYFLPTPRILLQEEVE